MTFSAPVESLNPHSTALREWEPRAPAGLKPALIAAADALDDQQKQIEDCAAARRLTRGMLKTWATTLQASTEIRIGQMDSPSRAAEKTAEGQRAVLDVVREMRGLL